MLVYLHGFASGPNSQKARLFRDRFADAGLELLVPALDEGDFEHLTLARQRRLLERLFAEAPRPHVLIGSSLGGYLAALHASAHLVDALVLMAPAVDFANRLTAREGPEALERWRTTGFTEVAHHALGRSARLAWDLFADAPQHAPFPKVNAPTLVFQGRHDPVVPLEAVERWVAATPGARLEILDAGHELTEPIDHIVRESARFLFGLPALARRYPQLALVSA